MLNMAVRNTNKLIRATARTEGIRLGRFFSKKTEASVMANMLSLSGTEEIFLLDAGAGTGILSAAAIEAFCLQQKALRIHLTCYENNRLMLPVLQDNLERIRRRMRRLYGARLFVTIIQEDFMEAPDEQSFDFAIVNPPSGLLSPKEGSMRAFADVCQGETDLSFVFALKALRLLKPSGQLSVILPSAFATGVYLENIRAAFLNQASLKQIVLADNGDRTAKLKGKAADAAPPFNKRMALSFEKGACQEDISLTAVSAAGDIFNFPPMPSSFIIRGQEKKFLLLRSQEELKIVRFVESQKENLSSLGLKMRTGLALSSRYADFLRATPEGGAVPLLRPSGLKQGRMTFPLNDGRDYLIPKTPALRQPNKNLLLIKRVPTKKDGRHIVAGVYHASLLPRTPYISTENKLNFIDYADGKREMSVAFMTGLYALFSSSLYDRYLTIVNSVRRINASDYASLPLPSEKMLLEIGSRMALVRVFDTRSVDAIVTAIFRKYSE